jgi:hypothetical protein
VELMAIALSMEDVDEVEEAFLTPAMAMVLFSHY